MHNHKKAPQFVVIIGQFCLYNFNASLLSQDFLTLCAAIEPQMNGQTSD